MNQKKQRTLAIFALAIALVATTVAYAALSTTLQVSGNVTKKGGTWAINIQNISNVTTTGTGKMTTEPSVSGTNLSFDAELAKPGDSVSFTFDLVNNGSVAAKMCSAKMDIGGNSKTLTSGSEMKVIKDDVIYELAMKEYDGNFSSFYEIAPEDCILFGINTTKTFRLTLTWDSASSIKTAESKTLTVTADFSFTQY